MSSLFRLLIIASCGISSGLGIVEGFSASASVGIRRASTASASARNIMNPPPPPPPPPPPSSSSSLPTNFGRGRGGWGRGGGRGRGRGRYGHGRGQGRGGGRGGRGRGRGGRGRGPVRMPNAALQYDRSQYDRIEEIIGYDDSQAANTGPTEMINIAVEGCCHGELEIIYDRLLDYEQEQGTKIDLLICCGDFQSIRNELDYLSCSIPPKYQKLGTFCKYYGSSSSSSSSSTTSTSTTRMAPIPTIFIGGNHEAMQPLRELYYGGYVAPNIYYLGSAGCIQYRGIRIGGISGIYKAHDYTKGHCETIPYGLVNRNDLKSAYHVRTVDIARMKLLQPQPTHAQNTTTTQRPRNRFDIVVSHDWPCGIEQHGNTAQLIRKKPFFKQEIHNNDLGSPPNREVLDRVQPKYWFAAHLHVKFHASVIHPPQQQHQQQRDIDGTATVSSQKSPAASSSSSSLLIPSQAMTSATTESDTRRNNKAIANADADADADSFIAFNDNTPVATATATAVAATTAAPAPNGEEHTNINTDKPNRTTTEFHGMETDRKCLPSNDEMIYVPDLVEQMTKFLALDKCLPRRQFLSVLKLKVPTKDASNDTKGNTTDAKGTQDEEDSNNKEDDDNNITLIENQNKKSNKVKEYHIEYDPEWLAILRKTHHWNTRQRYQHPISKEANNLTIKDADIDWIIRRLKDVSATDTTNSNTINDDDDDDDDRSFLEIPRDFVPTVPYYNDKAFVNSNNKNQKQKHQPLPVMGNPQTDRFLNMLQLDHIITQPYDPVFTPERISEMLLGQQQQCQEQQQGMFYHNGRGSSTNTNSTSKHNNIARAVVVPLPVSLPLPPPPPPPTNIVAPDSNEIELDDDALDDDDDNNDDNEIDIDIDMDDEDEENAAGDNDDNSDNNISDRDMQTKSNNIPTKTATTAATSCNAIIDDDGNNNNDDNNEIDIDNLSREDDNDNVDDADDGNSEIMTVKKARLGI